MWRTWSGFKFTNGSEAESFFAASTSVAVRDGRKALFWSDTWLDGFSIRSLAPNLWGVVSPRVRGSRTTRDDLLNRAWVCDISSTMRVNVILQYIKIWDPQANFTLSKVPDRFI
jgi:hypothetical protein